MNYIFLILYFFTHVQFELDLKKRSTVSAGLLSTVTQWRYMFQSQLWYWREALTGPKTPGLQQLSHLMKTVSHVVSIYYINALIYLQYFV